MIYSEVYNLNFMICIIDITCFTFKTFLYTIEVNLMISMVWAQLHSEYIMRKKDIIILDVIELEDKVLLAR
jgi:hypothetical protein